MYLPGNHTNGKIGSERNNDKPLQKREPRAKSKIIVKENIQLIPPYEGGKDRESTEERIRGVMDRLRVKKDERKNEEEWKAKTYRKSRREMIGSDGNERMSGKAKGNNDRTTSNVIKRRPPKTVAIVIEGE